MDESSGQLQDASVPTSANRSDAAIRVVALAPTPTPYRALEFDRLARELAGEMEFHLLLMARAYENLPWRDDVPRLATWEELPRLSWSALQRVPGLERVNLGVRRRLDVLRPNVVLLHGYDAPALWAALFWARRNRRALLYRSDSNGLDERERMDLWKSTVKRCVLRWFLSKMDAFLTIGSANEDYLKLYGAADRAFFRTGYQADTELHGRIAADERARGMPLRTELGIRHARLILYVGRLIPQKGILDLVAAFKRVRAEYPDTGLLLVGDGPQRAEIAAQSAEIGEHVYFCGFLQPAELGRAYGIANLLVLPSTYEPWGVVVNEAMAAGMPVIASHRVGAAPDLILPGVSGETFRATDVAGLAGCLRTLLAGDAAARYGLRVRELVRDWTQRYEPVQAYRSAVKFALQRAATRTSAGAN